MSNQKDKIKSSSEKEFIEMSASGNLKALETLEEESGGFNKVVLTNALIELCKNYKTVGDYENCLNFLLRYVLALFRPKESIYSL